MEKEHFEFLLERIEDNTKLALEGISTANDRLDRLEARQDETNQRLDRLETGQAEMKRDLRELKSTAGLLHSIANDHETRLRRVEAALEDHLAEHHTQP